MTRHRIGVTAKFHGALTVWGLGVLCILMLGGVGCSRNSSEYSQSPHTADFYLTGIRPPAGDTHRLLRNAHYLELMGRRELALRELEAAHQQDPQNIQVLNALAQAYDQMGEYSQAQKLYHQALALDTSNPALNNNLCFSYYLASEWDKAEACFRQALTRDPKNTTARNNLGLLLCRRGRNEEARRLWQEAEGEMAAREKMQKVMAVLGMTDTPQYAQIPQSAPAASRPLPQSSPPAPTAARDTTPVKVALAGSSAPKPQVPVTPPAKTREPVKPAAKPGPAANLAPKKPAPPVLSAAPAKHQASPAPLKQTADTAKKPAPAAKSPAAAKPAKVKLSPAAAQLASSGLEVQNGCGVRNLAHRTSAVLQAKGFQVVSIGDYRHFQVEKTIIFYRPEAEEVARDLRAGFFPGSRLKMSKKITGNAQVKVILGKDRVEGPARADKPSLTAEKIAASTAPGRKKPQPLTTASAAPAPVTARLPQPAPAKVAAPTSKPAPAKVTAFTPKASTKVAASKGRSKPYLTAADMVALVEDWML